MAKSMTEGNPLSLILKFSLPLLAGNIFQQTYNIMDAAIVGRFLGTDALGAVGASTSVQFLVLGFCTGMCVGFTVPVAQRFGAKDYHGMRQYMFMGILQTAFFGLIVTLLTSLLCHQILYILRTPSNIYDDAYRYLLVLFLGIPFTLMYNLLSGILRAVGDSKTPFIFLLISTVLNIGLDLLCIVVLGWGCAGAAIATIASQAVSGILCLVYIVKRYEILHIRKMDRSWSHRMARVLLKMGLPMGLQFSITAIGSMIMQSANNSLGSVYVSGFTAASRVKAFCMCPYDALATAVATFASQNYGACKVDRIKKGLVEGVCIGVLYGILIGLVQIFFGRNLALIFIDKSHPEVIDAAARIMHWSGLFFWTLGILNVARLTVQGLGFSTRAIFSGVIEMIARSVVSFAFVPFFGFGAICVADQTAWVSAIAYIIPTSIIVIHKIEKMLEMDSKPSEKRKA